MLRVKLRKKKLIFLRSRNWLNARFIGANPATTGIIVESTGVKTSLNPTSPGKISYGFERRVGDLRSSMVDRATRSPMDSTLYSMRQQVQPSQRASCYKPYR